MNEKVTVDDIIGLIECEPTNSVEEVRKLRGRETEKRFWYDFEDCNGPKIIDFKKDKEYPLETIGDFRGIEELLNSLNDENEQLKKDNNELEEEIARQKFTKKMMRENIKDYEKAIKNLRKSFENFDEMRLKRIRFLEQRLKRNGLSIYVNDCGDVE